MRKLYLIFTFISVLALNHGVWAQSSNSEHQKLQDEISSLKSKMKSSRDVKPKDLQKLTELENQLQKSQFLNNSQSR
ncbi:MAG: hypothetical protein M9899_09710 [Bdellovibrionaceae bacterium]|nr:hypothetical protein [Pseudobdellovibrionaceae bacterium]